MEQPMRLLSLVLPLVALVLVCARAHPTEASLKIAEKLLNEALKKEIDDELRDAMSKGSNEAELPGGSDADSLEEFLEAAIKEMKRDSSPDHRGTGGAKDSSLVGLGSKRMGKNKAKSGMLDSKAKTTQSYLPKKPGLPSGQKREGAGDKKLPGSVASDKRLMPEGSELLLNALGIPKEDDVSDFQMYQADLDSLKQLESLRKQPVSSLVTGTSHNMAQSAVAQKSHENELDSKLPQTKNEEWQKMSDDELASKMDEFYKIVQQYADKNEAPTEPLDEAWEDQYGGLVARQRVLPLDQPINMRSKGATHLKRQAWLQQKRGNDNAQLQQELQQLAESLKKGSQDTAENVFPSIGKWFRIERAAGRSGIPLNGGKGQRRTGRRRHRVANAYDEVFQKGDVRDADGDFPWSKYFGRGNHNLQGRSLPGNMDFQETERDATESQEEKFMDEIEARVAELQRRMEATSDRRRGLRAEKLRM